MTAVTATPQNLADRCGSGMVKIRLHNECPHCGKVSDTDIETDAFVAQLMIGRSNTKNACAECSVKLKEAENSRLHQMQIEENLQNCGIEEEFFGTWDGEKGNRPLANAIRTNADKHLFVVGEYNIGKTRCTCVNLERQISKGKRGKYHKFSKLAHQYSQSFSKGETAPDEFIRSILHGNDIIIIDDICKRRVTQTAAEFIYDLLDAIYSSNSACRVWFTSNTVPAELHKKFESRDLASAVASRIDRLHDAGKLVLIKGEDLEK